MQKGFNTALEIAKSNKSSKESTIIGRKAYMWIYIGSHLATQAAVSTQKFYNGY
jgi:hypothetical protein